LERTVSVQVDLPGAVSARNEQDNPLHGTPETIAAALRGHADQGISHIQVLLNPNTLAAIEAFAPVLALLDHGNG
jgi:alkanesulfonate monooxygenase SsuD/methylene tetrahydromethanopterin reductase-like flavin-dependent oxidoreductase (luciferase family)